MPNGGPRPDCFHCKNYGGGPFSHEKPFCEFHKIDLPTPLYAFCVHYADPEPQGKDWLDEELDREQLLEDMMYVWLGGGETKHFAVPLVAITEYGTWTRERFIDQLTNLNDKYNRS
ncbi:MAG TPA: hypothetical protein VKQ72_09350 [Aggregatilineales bacterium]|nr:hypothetical protein [Aggregatilineales bacterium]